MGTTADDRLSPRITVAVIIPVCNGGRTFLQCLRAMLGGHSQPDEIIVAANGCTDRSAEVARLTGATVIEFPHPIGPAAARNAAARRAQSDILFFVDADVAVHPDALDRVRACFHDQSRISACFGSYDDAPPEKNFFSQYKNLFHHFIHQQARPQATTFWAGCGAIRRVVFEEIGGFNEEYREPAIEDIELGYRLTDQGLRILLDKELLATHLKHWSLGSLLRTDILNRALPWSRLIQRGRSSFADLNLRLHHRLSSLLAVLLLVVPMLAFCTDLPIRAVGIPAAWLLVLNTDWYFFLLKRKGPGWTIRAVVWHWVYYFYCALAYSWATAEKLSSSRTYSNEPLASTKNAFLKGCSARHMQGESQPPSKMNPPRREKLNLQDLRVLRIRVIDWALLRNHAGSLDIDRVAAERLGQLDHIVYSPLHNDLHASQLADNFNIYPTRSYSKFNFFNDALKIAHQLQCQHRYHLLYADDPMWAGLVGYILKRRYRLPLLLECHSDYYSSRAWILENPRYVVDFLLSLWIVRKADKIKPVSQRVARDLVRLGANPEKITVLPTPIMTSRFGVKKWNLRHQDEYKILFVGRLEKSKNIPLLIDAMASTIRTGVKAELTIAGKGSQYPLLKQKITRLGLAKRIHLIGFQPHRQLPAIYRAHDILVLPSAYEAFGRVIVEAGLCGTPTVASRVGGIPELIEHGHTGLLVPPGDVSALAAAITTLLKNPMLTRKMGRQAAEIYRHRFAFPAILEKQLKMFAEAAGIECLGRRDG